MLSIAYAKIRKCILTQNYLKKIAKVPHSGRREKRFGMQGQPTPGYTLSGISQT